MARNHIQGPSGYILDVNSDGSLKGIDEIIEGLGGVVEEAATGGTTSTLQDTKKDWEENVWKGSILEVTVNEQRYFRKIASNTDDTLNFDAALDDAVEDGDLYKIIPSASVVRIAETPIQDDEETLKTIVDAIEALQDDEETLKTIVDAIEALQDDDETLKTIVDAVEALIDQMPLKTIVDPNDGGNVLAMVDVAPWAIERVTGAKTVIKSDHAAIHEGEGYVSSLMLPGVAADSDVEIVIETGSTKYVHLKDYEAWTEGAKATLMLFEGAIHDGYDFGPQRSTSVNRNRLEDMPESEVTVTKSPTNLLFLDADITGVDTTDKEFVIAGDHEDKFSVGSKIYIHNSTGNDGPYTVVSATHDVGGETTTIVVEEEIVNSTADGALYNANLLEVIKFGSGGEVTEGATGQGGGSSGQGGNKTLDIEWVLKQDTSYLLKITNEWSESADISVWLYWYEEEEA